MVPVRIPVLVVLVRVVVRRMFEVGKPVLDFERVVPVLLL